MMQSFVLSAIAAVFLTSTAARAETHTIRFDNKCGKGTPQLIQGGKVLSTGEDYVHQGVFSAGIAYLQTGECLFNGEKCTTLEMTLVNPTVPGGGSSTDISLIAPHAFNVEASFSYFNGCDNQGATCSSPNCNTAFFQPNDNQVQVQCQTDNVDLLITFCGDATAPGSVSQPATSSRPATTSIKASSVESTSVKAPTSSASPTHTVVTPTSIAAAPATTVISSVVSAPSASSGRCAKGSARRRRRDVEVPRASHNMRRHHARNAEAVRGVTI